VSRLFEERTWYSTHCIHGNLYYLPDRVRKRQDLAFIFETTKEE
jgi:hypothetical protein